MVEISKRFFLSLSVRIPLKLAASIVCAGLLLLGSLVVVVAVLAPILDCVAWIFGAN